MADIRSVRVSHTSLRFRGSNLIEQKCQEMWDFWLIIAFMRIILLVRF